MSGSAGPVARGNASRTHPFPPITGSPASQLLGQPIPRSRGRASRTSSSLLRAPHHQDPAFLRAHCPPFALPSPPVGGRAVRHRGAC